MLKLPRLNSDGCVLQRGTRTRIWGWCDPKESVTVSFLGMEKSVRGDEEGRWKTEFSDLPCGGPFPMTIMSEKKERITLSHVYVGDVWVCSGQSNMNLPIERVKDQYPAQLLQAKNPYIRIFSIEEHEEFESPLMDCISGEWKACDPENIRGFSAFSYFFASYLQEDQKVPIGVIHASVGGSRIEAWMGRDALAEYPEFLNIVDQYCDSVYVKKYFADIEKEKECWNQELERLEKLNESGEWKDILLPGFLEERGILDFSGVLYLRKKIQISASMEGKTANLWLGTLVDSDKTYVNGRLIGETGYQYPPRKYQIPEGILKEGENEIQIRLICENKNGRVTPGKEMCLFSEDYMIDLKGIWQYRIGCCHRSAPEADFIWRKPAGLYQGMLAPCQFYEVKGVVWYQGESNDRWADQYEELLKRMITSWRKQWDQENLPFVIIQLPNFDIDLIEKGSGWPEIREAQSHTGKLSEVAVTVNLDLGEDNDLHPLRKKEVAYRAALAARGMVYGEHIVWKSPIMNSWNIQGDKVYMIFDTGDENGLFTEKEEGSEEFQLAGEDRIFYPAVGKVIGNQVEVSSVYVRVPIAVRYAWGNAPKKGLLYNRAGLPAHPFRTDNWSDI